MNHMSSYTLLTRSWYRTRFERPSVASPEIAFRMEKHSISHYVSVLCRDLIKRSPGAGGLSREWHLYMSYLLIWLVSFPLLTKCLVVCMSPTTLVYLKPFDAYDGQSELPQPRTVSQSDILLRSTDAEQMILSIWYTLVRASMHIRESEVILKPHQHGDQLERVACKTLSRTSMWPYGAVSVRIHMIEIYFTCSPCKSAKHS